MPIPSIVEWSRLKELMEADIPARLTAIEAELRRRAKMPSEPNTILSRSGRKRKSRTPSHQRGNAA